jgi:hypothetical protein
MSTVPFDDVDTSRISSKFQREAVEHDVRKTFGRWVATGDFDLLVMDIIPERYALFVNAEGAVATRSSEFLATGTDVSAYSVVGPYSQDFFRRWAAAWQQLVLALDAADARDRLRINRVRWADTFDGPGATFLPYHEQRIERSNAFLERAYSRMERDLAPEQFYRYRPEELLAATEHQWGRAPFHYTPAFYRRFTEHVTGRRVPGPGSSWRGEVRRVLGRRGR